MKTEGSSELSAGSCLGYHLSQASTGSSGSSPAEISLQNSVSSLPSSQYSHSASASSLSSPPPSDLAMKPDEVDDDDDDDDDDDEDQDGEAGIVAVLTNYKSWWPPNKDT